MAFNPLPDRLIPDLSPREELVLLARALWREGYDDHLAGHLTCRLGDGTLPCNPWLLTWEEIRPADILRNDVTWAAHHHSRFGVVWADMGEVPPIMDQSSALGGGELVLVDEYRGPVDVRENARLAVEAMADATASLLAAHRVNVLGGSARAVHQRAVAFEQRCQHAWYVRAAGGRTTTLLPQSFLDAMYPSTGERFVGFWEGAVCAELRADPGLLEGAVCDP